MTNRPRHLRPLFASLLAACAAAPLVACKHGEPATTATPEPVDANDSKMQADTTKPVFPRRPFTCPPPFTVVVDGGLPDAGPIEAGATVWGDAGLLLPAAVCRDPNVCGARAPRCTLIDAGPPPTVECGMICIGGRRPAGYCAARTEGAAVGAWLASLAQLEAASVPAFRRAARELAGLGAPRRLVKACERAARDEVRHARAARSLAKRRGGRAAAFETSDATARSLEAFAIENAVEGCVRETYAALVAERQARYAQDPRIRVHFARIARDETRHAELSWRLDAWAGARLDRAARARVDAAKRAARESLRASLAAGPEPALARVAGLPGADEALRLEAALAVALA